MRRGTCQPSLTKWLGWVSFHPEFSRSSHAGSSGSAWGPLPLPLPPKDQGHHAWPGKGHRPRSPVVLLGMVGCSEHSWENWTRPLCSQLQEIYKAVKPGRVRGGSLCTPVCVLGVECFMPQHQSLTLWSRQWSPKFLRSLKLDLPPCWFNPSPHPGTLDAAPSGPHRSGINLRLRFSKVYFTSKL